MRGFIFILVLLLGLISPSFVRAQEWLLPIPETFPIFFSSNTANDTLLNDFFYRHFSAMVGPSAITGDQQTEWREWDSLATVWIDTNTNKIMSNACNVLNPGCDHGPPCGSCQPYDYNFWLKKNLLEVKMEDNGMVWTYWDWGRDWPCAPDCGVWHPTNNTAFVMASSRYFKWTNDTVFLRNQISRIRKALRLLQVEMHGDELNLMENRMPGHDGLTRLGEGHGKTSNYWDVLPFGFRDAYLTIYYYASLKAMADIEGFIGAHPELGIERNPYGETAFSYRTKAARVKDVASVYFWHDPTWPGGAAPKNFQRGRMWASIDAEGVAHEYGYTFLNLEAIFNDFLNETQARAIFSWLTGDGSNEFLDDRSRGSDIYHYIFAPRMATKHNNSWYTPWFLDLLTRTGGLESWPHFQNGGGDLFISFYDILGRVKVLGPDNAYARLREILSWYQQVWSQGGYREYYITGHWGLQGCGEGGHLGIDCEFTESTLVPLSFLYGFLGVEARTDGLRINPRIPSELSFVGVDNLFWQGKLYKITASRLAASLSVSFSGGKTEITIPADAHLLIPFGSNSPFLLSPLSLKTGWNKIIWPNLTGKTAEDLPNGCFSVAGFDNGLLAGFVRGFWPTTWAFFPEGTHFIRCASPASWQL